VISRSSWPDVDYVITIEDRGAAAKDLDALAGLLRIATAMLGRTAGHLSPHNAARVS
jgi:hypothetical protein